MEMIMLAPLDLETISLPARTLHRIEDARGTQVTCVSGVTWVTQEKDPRDLILAAGQSFVLDKGGLAVVFAFKDAVITVGEAVQFPALAAPARAATPANARANRAWA
jgi:hypothetical protein